MGVIRITGLTSLVLAASTMPANAHLLLVPAEDAQARGTDAPQPAPSDPADEQPESSPAPEITLSADVWHGGSPRAANGHTPAPSTPPAAILATPPSPVRTLLPLVRDAAHRPDERSQRRWLSGRYAHAPPVGA